MNNEINILNIFIYISKMKVFIDGSSKKNKYDKWCGGIGVFIPEIDYKYSKGFHNCTNQRAELLSCLKALYVISKYNYDNCDFFSDSMYCINVCTKWMYKWEKNEWKKQGGNILHLDVIKRIYSKLKDNKDIIKFHHIRSHTKFKTQSILNVWNEEAKKYIDFLKLPDGYQNWLGNKIVDDLANKAMKKCI